MSRASDILSGLGTAILVGCALVVTMLVVKRELGGNGSGGGEPLRSAARWEHLAEGRALGRDDAPVKMVIFSDFQCPFCAAALPEIERLRAGSEERIAVIFRHLPLEAIHPHAFVAAMASECAGEQGRFEAYHDALFAAQGDIGTRSWIDFAREAGVPSLGEFDRCLADEHFGDRVRADLAAAKELGVTGTPTFVYEGRIGTGAPGLAALGRQAMKAARR